MKVRTEINKIESQRNEKINEAIWVLWEKINVYWVPPMGQVLFSRWGYSRKRHTKTPGTIPYLGLSITVFFSCSTLLPGMPSPNNLLVSLSCFIFLQRTYYTLAFHFSVFFILVIFCLSFLFSLTLCPSASFSSLSLFLSLFFLSFSPFLSFCQSFCLYNPLSPMYTPQRILFVYFFHCLITST